MIVGGRREIVLLVVFGLALGIAVGLYVGWEVWPVPFYESDPAHLSRRYVEDYIILIAGRHSLDGDVEQSRERLYALNIPDIEGVVAQLTNRYMAEGREVASIRSLARLSHDLGVGTSGMVVYLQTATATPAPTEVATATPTNTTAPTPFGTPTPNQTATLSTSTPSPTPPLSPSPTHTPQPALLLTERRRICSQEAGPGQIQVVAQDAQGKGLPGVKIIISWGEGDSEEETFFTGLKPAQGPGYADFDLRERDRVYAIRLPFSGDIASELAANPGAAGCPIDSVSVSWQLTFVDNRR